MNILTQKLTVATLAMMTMLSCVKEVDYVTDVSNNQVVISVVNEEFETKGAQVNAASQLPSLRILAYNTADNTEFINSSAVYTDQEWVIPSTTWGSVSTAKFTAYSPCLDSDGANGLEVLSSATDKTIIKYTMPVYSCDQPDLMTACTQASNTASSSIVSLKFEHALSSVGFKVEGADMSVSSIALKGIYNAGELTVTNNGTSEQLLTWYLSGEYSDLNKSHYATLEEGINIDDMTFVMSDDGYFMALPQTVSSYAKIEVTFADAQGAKYVQSYGFPTSTVWEMGKSYTYKIYYDEEKAELDDSDDGSTGGTTGDGSITVTTTALFEGDYQVWDYTVLSSSNSYIVNPSTAKIPGTDDDVEGVILYIPIEERIDDFYTNYQLQANPIQDNELNWVTKLLWHDSTNWPAAAQFSAEPVYTGFANTDCKSALRVVVPKDITYGNFVVAVKLNNTILWSWHFWVTSYCPYGMEAANPAATTGAYNQTTADGSGRVQSYTASAVFQSGGMYEGLYMMDRNIGAKSANCWHGGLSGSVYYQWGRKDPFPGGDGIYHSDYTYETEEQTNSATFEYMAEMGTKKIVYSVNNPDIIIGSKLRTTNGYYDSYYYDWSSEYYSRNVIGLCLWRDINAPNPMESSSSYTSTSPRKSIYDPSPWGWCVPVYDIVTGLSSSSNTKVGSNYITYDNGDIYFPFEGYITYKTPNNGTNYNGYDYTYDQDELYLWAAGSYYTSNTSSTWYYHYDGWSERITSSSTNITKTLEGTRIEACPVRSVQENNRNPYEEILEAYGANE